MSTISSAGWLRRVDRAPHLVDAARAAGRGLVVDDADRLDAVRAILGERRADRLDIGAAPPIRVDEFGHEAELLRHLLPQAREPAGAAHQHGVARRERVGERRLPRAGAGGRVDHHRPLGLEHLAQIGEHLAPELAEFRAAMIHGRVVHRAQHAVRHVGRPRDLQEMPPGLPVIGVVAAVCRHGWSSSPRNMAAPAAGLPIAGGCPMDRR